MPSKPTFALRVLVDAVRRRVDETSIRAVAEEIGMSPSGLHVLLSGSKPHPGTRQKLVDWYVARRDAKPEVSNGDVDAAVRLLLAHIRSGSGKDVQRRRAFEIIRLIDAETDLGYCGEGVATQPEARGRT